MEGEAGSYEKLRSESALSSPFTVTGGVTRKPPSVPRGCLPTPTQRKSPERESIFDPTHWAARWEGEIRLLAAAL